MYKALVQIVKYALYPFIRVKVDGVENIPKDTGYVLAANHLSNWDPIAIAIACPDELNFMAKKELFDIKPLGWLIGKLHAFPVDRNANDVRAIKKALTILKNEKPLLIFPEGKRMKDYEKTDDDAKDGMTLLAHRAKVPIVTAAIIGKYRIFRSVKVVFNKPMYLDEYYGTKLDSVTMHKISSEVLNEIRKMQEETKKSLAKK